MQTYLKYKEYYDRKDKAATLKQNDYCFILQPIADHQGSKNPFREYRWTGAYIVEMVLPNENYIVRKLNSNKTQILHRMILCKYEPNTVLQDIGPGGNLQPADEIIIPQEDLYVITRETNFGEFPYSTEEVTIPTRVYDSDTSYGLVDDTSPPGKTFTDVDFRSTEPHGNDDFDSPAKNHPDHAKDRIDDQQSSGGAILSCPKYKMMKTMM